MADEWFKNPIQTIPVKVVGPFSATADGACEVEFAGSKRGYVKPRRGAQGNLLCAREKIASDLAHLLSLPIAAVVIRSPELPDWPYYSALSLASLESARHWGTGGAMHLPKVGETLEGLRVFWTWIGDSDHNGHPNNLLFTVQGSQCQLLGIDHAYSLCHGNAGDPLAVGACAGYGSRGLPDGTRWARDMVTKIVSLDWAMIELVVTRLAAVLSPAEQVRVLKVLEERRGKLAVLLGL